MSATLKSVLKMIALTLLVVGAIGVLLGITIAREVPTGTLQGKITDENGRPIAQATVTVRGDTNVVKRGVTNDSGEFVITDVPTGRYTGYATARGYETRNLRDGGDFRVYEGQTTVLSPIHLYPRPPAIYGSIPSVFVPGEKVKFPLRGYSRNAVARVRYSVYKFDFASRVRQMNGASEPYQDSMSRWKNLGPAVYQNEVSIRTDREGYFSRDVTLPVKDNGGYLIHVELETTEALFKTFITDLALVAKRAPGKTLIYASSFSKKQPLQDVNLEFYGSQGKMAVSGKTGPDGLFITGDLPTAGVTILGESGESCAINYSYAGENEEKNKCYMYTDRPVYRPGHTVYFKGIARKSIPGRYEPTAGVQAPVTITDPDGNNIQKLQLRTGKSGSFDGKFELASDAASGYYSIVAEIEGERHYCSFKVEEYRKPEYSVSAAFDKPSYIGGQAISARVESTYYFGAPVAQARVKYTVYKSPDYFYYYPDEDSDTSFYDEFFAEEYGGDFFYGYGEVVMEGEAVTDENGVARLRIPTKKTREEQRYSIEVSVTDASGRSVDAGGGVMVTPAQFTFSLNTDRYFYKPGKQVSVDIYAVDYQRKRMPNVNARISLIELRDYSGKKIRTVWTRDVRLDSRGYAKFSFKPEEEGYFQLEVEARDRLRNRATGSTTIWIADENWSGDDYDAPALEIAVDKKIYNVGDTARVMINAPEKDCWVLFTIEGRRLFEQRVIHMDSTSKMLDIPVVQDYSSNVFASACTIKGKKFAVASRPVFVSPKNKFLTVKIEPDKQRYQPGEQATYRIRTLDSHGKGVPAEVSLGIVDESLYAIREDTTEDIRTFFHGPVWNSVNTSISFSSEYYGGEDKFQGKVRKYFPDTAYWNPAILTDTSGNASVTFKFPDNLTTWRATARAVTADTSVGSAVHKVLVTKNLLVRLQTPRFYRQRDRVTLSAVVHNYTSREQNVRVWVEASGIDFSDTAVRTLRLGPQGAGRLEWNARADNPGTARIAIYAQGQGDQDAMEMEVPVLPHGVPEIVAASGEVETSREFVLTVSDDAIRGASTLSMGLSASVAGAALGLTDALQDYRMESPGGIMDVLLPNVVMYQAMKQLGADFPEQNARIREMVQKDLKTVYRWQLSGGGWGWSEYGDKDPWMTAYVVYGLIRAKRAGLPVNQEVLDKGIKAAEISMPNAGDLGKRSTIIYVLALAGRAKSEWVAQVLKDKRLQNYSLSLMMLSLVEMGQVERARTLVPQLEKGAVDASAHCYWPETFPWGFYSCNQYETTAYAVRALLAVDPDNPRIDKAIRWLVDRRKGDRYDMNYDTASVVYALADYLQVRKPSIPDYTVRVYLNGDILREYKINKENLYKPELRLDLTGTEIKSGRNIITVVKDGPGDLYFWSQIKYYSSAEDLKSVKNRISVERQYYRMELVRDPKEGLVYKPRLFRGPAKVGEIIRCRLTVRSPKNFQYLVVEDMLPSGCEVLRRQFGDFGEWSYWWSGESVHDNRVSFLLHQVYEGMRLIEYDFRPELRGDFHVMPATAQGYFEPDIFAHSSERRLSVK